MNTEENVVAPRKKINPSKSRQGRAIQVNGAMRNPFWTPPRLLGYTPERNRGLRKHPRTASDEEIKSAKANALACSNVARVTGSDHYRRLAKRFSRKYECFVSRQLDTRWTVLTVEE